MHRLAALLLCSALAVGTAVVAAPAPTAFRGWGTVKGRVVFEDASIPTNQDAAVTKDRPHCLAKGPLKLDELVVNPRNRGVRWVLVFLAPVKDFRNGGKGMPVRASLKSPDRVEIDVPTCVFVPRVTAMRAGTTLVFKNSAPVPHNVTLNGGAPGPHFSRLLPSKGQLVVKGVKARFQPFGCNCSIHSWMKCWIAVFDHPHFAVTDADGHFEIRDAPAGKWRLILWQEKVGWVINRGRDNIGRIITVKGKGTIAETVLLRDEE